MKRFVLFLLLFCASPAHATVNEVFARNDYVGNASTTSFPYTFRIINQADVLVLLDGVVQTLNVAYTVIGVDNAGGGAVIFSTAPPSGAKVALLRGQRFQQLSIYTPNEAFPAKRIESDFDKNMMEDQRHVEEIGRALKFDPHSLYRNVFVDDPIAGKCLSWNSALTRVVAADCSGGGGGVGPISGDGVAGQVTFWTGPATIAGDGKFLWDNSAKALTVGTLPLGPLKPGNAFMGLQGPSDTTGMQNLQLQTVQGDPSLIGLVTLGDDRVGISSWNFRGTGATNPIYGANFGVVFNTNGVANGLEIDVQNDSATNYQGQALWLNGSTRAAGASGTVGHRANAILIDTQDGSKWERGILFKEGFVGNGATGSIEKMGIHFEQSQDADFIVIQPRVGSLSNVAVKLTNPEFTLNRFELLNSGTLRVSNSITGPAFPAYSFIEGAGPTAGMYLEAVGTASPASGAVLGWAVNSLRRLTLGNALNVWNSGGGTNQGGTINFFDPTATHSVGFMAPDFIGNSFTIKIPAVPGASGQCVITDGAFPVSTWSYAACGTGGGGSGGTVTNTGVLALNQLILGNGGVDVKPMGTLGTATTVLHGNAGGAPAFGPVIVADIGATGTPSSSTFLRGDGTWSTPPGSGTVTTSGSPLLNHIAFFTAPTVVSGSASFTWDEALKKHTVLGNVIIQPPLETGNSIFSIVQTASTTNIQYPLLLRANSTGQMANGFGPGIAFSALDADNIHRSTGALYFYRVTNDDTYYFGMSTTIGGVTAERISINQAGQFVYFPPPAGVGAVQLAATGTTRTPLQFYTNNLANTVSFIAPATATGNHIWTLPTTLGAAGTVFTNDGAGNLSWAAPSGITGSGVTNRVAFFTGTSAIGSDAGFTFTSGELVVGSTPAGTQAVGPVKVGINTADNVNPYQAVLAQTVNGTITPGPATVANDRVAVAGSSFRGTGGTAPIYGGHFGVTFSTAGVANGVEIGVQNLSSTATQGQGLWVNGSGTNSRSNAILIDTQDSSKWNTGIRFTEGNTGAGATGSISNFGILFDKSHDVDFLVIRPRVGTASNIAIRLTDPGFTVNKFSVANDGAVVADRLNLAGAISAVGNIGGNQFFSGGSPGFGTPGSGTTKVAGACTFTISGGLIINVTGC